MSHLPDLVAVETLRAHVPSFAGPLEALAADYGEDLTAQVVFQELADLVAAALVRGEHERFLDEAFAALEVVAGLERADAVEAVGLCFLGSLPAEVLTLAAAYLGPRCERLLDELLDGTLDLEPDPDD